MDKYGNTLLIAFVLGIITITKLPKSWISVLPFGKQNIYGALVVCVVVYILMVNYIRHLYINFMTGISLKRSSERYHQEQNQKTMQNLWDMVDNFSEADRADLKEPIF